MTRLMHFIRRLFFLLVLLVSMTVHAQENDQQPDLITGWDGDLQALLWRPDVEELTIVTTTGGYAYHIDQPGDHPFTWLAAIPSKSLTWSPDGKHLLIEEERGGLTLIDPNFPSYDPNRYFYLPHANCPVSWYPDGEQLLAVAGSDVVRWNWKADEIERYVMDFRHWIEFLALGEDSHTVYVQYGVQGSRDEQGIYNLETQTWSPGNDFYIGNYVTITSYPHNWCVPQFISVLQQDRSMLEAPPGEMTPPAPSVTGVPLYPVVISEHQMPAETALLYNILHISSLEGTAPRPWRALNISPHKDAIAIANNSIHRIIVYQAGTYVQVATLTPEDVGLDEVQQLAWASDGCRIAVGDSDSIYVWHLDAEALGCE
ncbi:MAG: hypothetical protein H6672_18460 [Anaerolineaceae bacterium]|nr:hypothetical protein [Anaerolineaceae bacterium]